MTCVRFGFPVLAVLAGVSSTLGGCSSDDDPGQPDAGGKGAVGGIGTVTGGKASGGSASGGAASGGTASGGAASGGIGTVTGGVASGGAAAGGAASGGVASGGAASGGAAPGGAGGAGGSAVAGSGSGGTGGGGSSLSAGCGKAPTIASGMYNNGNPIAITAASKQRRYILSVPENYDNSKPYRLVIAWHQLDGNDKQMYQQKYYWLKDIADASSSTIFVAPNGEKNGAPCTGTGNGESGCGWPDSGGSNVELADAVVKQVTDNFCVDTKKIFANGWSYGGSMSYRTACSRPLGGTGAWGVRGVAIYNGAAQLSAGGCSPSKPVAFYASHGTNDNVLTYDGGVSMAQTYAKQNSCTWMTPTKASGNHVCTQVSGCAMGYPVEFCSFVGPHTPDPQEGGQRWQPQEVWKFFSQF